tara:strand:- start:720 stop:1049 length:330 start_codon:yes stop_codon:yes gene_type:complete
MVHSSCPKCPDDFKVKNIPSEVECLVTNKISSSPEIMNEDTGLIDLSGGDIRLTGNIPVGRDQSGQTYTFANLLAGDKDVYINTPSGLVRLGRGKIFQDEDGSIWVVLQ